MAYFDGASNTWLLELGIHMGFKFINPFFPAANAIPSIQPGHLQSPMHIVSICVPSSAKMVTSQGYFAG